MPQWALMVGDEGGDCFVVGDVTAPETCVNEASYEIGIKYDEYLDSEDSRTFLDWLKLQPGWNVRYDGG